MADQYGVGCADEFGVEWAVDGSCATIDGEGILTPVAEGECVVTAQSGTAVDRRTVRVLSTLVPSALRISPAYMEVEEGAVAEVAVLAADSYCGDGWSLAYRVFDAQYWGVPQRRRRIYLVLDLRGQRAGKVSFEREGVRGDFAESGTPWKAVV